MSKLYFRYWAMWAWKSAELISTYYNYQNKWMDALVLNFKLDNRFGESVIWSRSWAKINSITFDWETNLKELLEEKIDKNKNIRCILIDESQFLKSDQVDDLARILFKYNFPIICFGLKSDFQSNLFEWSKRLLELAHDIQELKTVCWCGRKATMNVRIVNGKITKHWEQIQIWADESYDSVCLEHYLENNLWEPHPCPLLPGEGEERKKKKLINNEKIW